MNSIEKTLVDLNQRILDFENSISERSEELGIIFSHALKIIGIIESSWSGYWLKSYADLYFNNFQKPHPSNLFDPHEAKLLGTSRGFSRRNHYEVERLIEEHCEFSIDRIREEISAQMEQATQIHDDLCIELSLIKADLKFADEVNELKEIEQIEWGVSVLEWVEHRKPKTLVISQIDYERGFEVPPHISCQANIMHFLARNSSILDFIKRAKKLIRKIQIKQNLVQERPVTINGIENVIKICNSFHIVARQLRQRHSNRNTLAIKDEYDVQDLFHALLRIFFEDVRSEEWTPSYAGGSSRVDFLLQPEKIVIELKKTRDGLESKEVGNQLLIDIARYQSHPDCKNLICFVYDPEGRIGNPKGLENDLNNLSSEKINIVTLIRPI
ncbi:MAG: hypothetical protein KME17_24085 [Cyanosarcina radialis HA8281-LM2]|jgi:hypothetical protein|nr:hypothetical protein [Cyanosarcina radialis HA8281-LM2]